MLITALIVYCLVWVLASSLTWWLATAVLGLLTTGIWSSQGIGLSFTGLTGLLFFGPALYTGLVMPFGFLNCLYLGALARHGVQQTIIRRSALLGLAIGLVELTASMFVIGSMATWRGVMLTYGLSAFVASVVCSYVVGRLYASAKASGA